ncbi:hypothetical protein Pla22_05730 [Rubripirellula amarantea]|uniref:3-keto-alpha-glucoside-1,2-lyase/3-keto-2-hydroxy-glucal hydratase domain-containing protein n=1 Tax=Rubripirellula amarantea TaxID=2527999 RepID=A0A5C5WS07_9BACT|nr:DUF1080 domain-containing protein [Rubripirellula amarantea]TWT52945.1 hypothetical protein Pla22_05730 [Rubripirellula amarantea]
MFRLLVVAATLLATVDLTRADDPKASSDAEFVDNSLELFDGQTLKGWEGNGYWFRVEDDCIVAGRSDEDIPHNFFLCTADHYDDFELRLEVKIIGPGQNAGVQFRSKRLPGGSEVSGYQADAGRAFDRSVWGALYDESRRRKMLAEGDPELVKRLTKDGQWNHLRIVCKGNQIEIFLNGEQTVDYTEEDAEIPNHGLIALQIHSGPATEAWYRNIRVRHFK